MEISRTGRSRPCSSDRNGGQIQRRARGGGSDGTAAAPPRFAARGARDGADAGVRERTRSGPGRTPCRTPRLRFLGRKSTRSEARCVSGPARRAFARRARARGHPKTAGPSPLGGGGDATLVGPRFPELRDELRRSSPPRRRCAASGARGWTSRATPRSTRACARASWRAGTAVYRRRWSSTGRHRRATSVTKCVASDLFVQKVVEGEGARRIGAWAWLLHARPHLRGRVPVRPVQPADEAAGAALAKRAGVGASVGFLVAVDQFLVCPIFYLPAFFGLVATADGECDAACRLRADGGGKPGGQDGGGASLVARGRVADARAGEPAPRAAGPRGRRARELVASGRLSAMNGAAAASAGPCRADADKAPEMKRRRVGGGRSAAVERREARGASRTAPAAPATAPAMEAWADERCVRALARSTRDALAVADRRARPGDGTEQRSGAGSAAETWRAAVFMRIITR